MEDNTDADYAHAKKVCKDFEIKILGDYHDFRWNIWELWRDVFWNIRAWFCNTSFSSWISMGSSFKKTKIKLDLLTDINMFLMVEKDTRGEICYSIYRHAKGNNKGLY